MSRTVGALAVLVLLAVAGAAHAEDKRTGAILPGGDSKQPVNIEATKLDYFEKEQKLIYTGSVVANQGAAKLKCTTLTILLAPKTPVGTKPAEGAPEGRASSSQVQHMVAVGPVTMIQRDQTGTGDNAVYDKALNTVVMTGNVTLSQGPNVTKGEKLTYDLKTGQAVVTGRVRSMFQPGSDSGTGPVRNNDAGGAATDEDGRRPPRKSSSR